jgi:hypothetical protein
MTECKFTDNLDWYIATNRGSNFTENLGRYVVTNRGCDFSSPVSRTVILNRPFNKVKVMFSCAYPTHIEDFDGVDISLHSLYS